MRPYFGQNLSSGNLYIPNRSFVKMKVTPTGPPTSERERIVLCHPETVPPPGSHAHARAKGGGDGGLLEAAASACCMQK